MKKKYVIVCIVLIVVSISSSLIALDLKRENKELREQINAEDVDKLGKFTLKKRESKYIEIADKIYKVEIKDIEKHKPCNKEEKVKSDFSCIWAGEYSVSILVNDIEFSLTSEFNPSHPLVSTDFSLPFIIYYIPEYKKEEATLYIERDVDYTKERNRIVGNYMIYVDDDETVLDITNFIKEKQTWGLKYKGMSFEDVKKMIEDGKDLKKEAFKIK